MNKNLWEEGNRALAEGGFEDKSGPEPGNSQRLSREYMDSLWLEMRCIDSQAADTRMNLFGETFAGPVFITALSGLDKVCPDGMAETARGALKAGVFMGMGIGEEEELLRIAGTGARIVKFVKPHEDKKFVLEKIASARKAGVFALGMDTDFFYGSRSKPRDFFPQPMGPKTLGDLKEFIKAAEVPFIVKGVLSEADAYKAAEAGAAGIVVSHHGGSALEYAVPPLLILPRIRRALGREFPILVDGGFRTGADVFKALALGATAAGFGRAVMTGLVKEGAQGVERVLKETIGELEWVMLHTNTPDLGSVDPSVIWGRQQS
ncbi:MAG: alpha-hydroxy-acid oxidizing protein [Spirochaetales bacterium]|nr:alpha-hydroxy-acid oxidizing protein [Spirochaetales bacterium]